ncbi:MAG: hypothetical protein HC887_10415 [Desulfobacteraceae bacterium]|nr:hypothetical protein [Desulfobacteraceae bacterium]
MSVISIEIADEWIRTAQWFGNAKDIIREALKSYSVEQCLKHIRDIAAKIAVYNKKYLCNYETFTNAVQTDKESDKSRIAESVMGRGCDGVGILARGISVMAEPTRNYFAAITDIAEKHLNRIKFKRLDVNSERSVWELHGVLSEQSDVRLKEIFTERGRKYSYYVIYENKVVIGFDNYPDIRLLQEKYGSDVANHIAEFRVFRKKETA